MTYHGGSWVTGSRRLTDEQIHDIRERRISQTRLAKKHGVSVKTIQDIQSGRVYDYVPYPGEEYLTVGHLMYLLSKHPKEDVVDQHSLNIEIIDAKTFRAPNRHVIPRDIPYTERPTKRIRASGRSRMSRRPQPEHTGGER